MHILLTGGTGLIVTQLAYHGVTDQIAAASPSLGAGVPVGDFVRTVRAPDAYRLGAENVAQVFADDVRAAEVDLRVEGQDGFVLQGRSSMRQISRDPVDLVQQTLNENHQYPDGLVLFDDDWLAPESSLRALMAKMPDAPARVHTLHHAALGTRANHFAWMKQPQAVVDALLS